MAAKIGLLPERKENKKIFSQKLKKVYNTFTDLADSRNHVLTGENYDCN